MSADTAELRLRMERVAHLIVKEHEQRATRTTIEHFGLRLCRNSCWAASALSGGVALGLSILRWEDVLIPPPGVIHWFVVGLGLTFLGALAIQDIINQKRTKAGQTRILSAVEAVDPPGIGRLAAQMQQVELDRGLVLGRLDVIEKWMEECAGLLADLAGASDDQFVDTLSAQEQSGDGKLARRVIRPARPDDGWPKRT